MLNCVLIGAGYIAQNHLAALQANKEVKLVGVVCREEAHARTITEKAGPECRYYKTLEEACAATKVDFVDICVPTNLHEEYTVKAAGFGCHVLCEKPVTFTTESFDRMVEACDKAGVKFMVAHVVRFMSEPMVVHKLIKEGKLGNVHLFYEKRLSQHPAWSTWHRDNDVSGGGLYDINIHDIDNLYWNFGMPKTVYAAGWKSPTGCWNHIATTLTWENGVKAVCETSLEMTGNFPFSVEIRGTGDKGTLQYNFTAGANINDSDVQTKLVWYPAGSEACEEVTAAEADGFCGEVDAFVDAVLNDTEVPVAASEVRDVLRIVLAIRKSLEENTVVTL